MAEIETVVVEKRPPINFRKARERRVGKIQPVSFQGFLSVDDPERLINTIFSGIGPAIGIRLRFLRRTIDRLNQQDSDHRPEGFGLGGNCDWQVLELAGAHGNVKCTANPSEGDENERIEEFSNGRDSRQDYR